MSFISSVTVISHGSNLSFFSFPDAYSTWAASKMAFPFRMSEHTPAREPGGHDNLGCFA